MTTDSIVETPYKFSSIQEILASIDLNEPMMFDTETEFFYGPIVLAQFYQRGWPEVLIMKDPDTEDIMTILKDVLTVAQFASYDLSTLQTQLNRPSDIAKEIKFEDTFLLARLHFYKEASFTLDNIMSYALGYDPYEKQGIDKKVLQKSKFKRGRAVSKEQCVYAATDVYYLPEVYDTVKYKTNDDSYILDKESLKCALSFQQNGMPVDELERFSKWKMNMLDIQEANMEVNVNSPKQVKEFLGTEDTTDMTLAKLSLAGNEDAIAVRSTRKLLKQNSFLEKKFKTDDGRIYGRFSPSARSGRFTCKEQNLQQIPRKLKGVFGYPEDAGKVLVYSDFSQLELRAAAAVIGEPNMAKLYYDGADLHTHTMNNIAWLATHEQGRTIAKQCNFNLLYGGSAGMLGGILLAQAGIMLPEETLYRLKSHWLKLWPAIEAWQKAGSDAHQRGVAWSTPLGRKYVGNRYTDQLNIMIQGAGADVAKLAMYKLCKEIKNMPVKLCNFIHDSYILDMANDEVLYKEVCEIVAHSMQGAWKEMSRFFMIKDIPMPVDVHVGYNWGAIESDDVDNLYDLEVA